MNNLRCRIAYRLMIIAKRIYPPLISELADAALMGMKSATQEAALARGGDSLPPRDAV